MGLTDIILFEVLQGVHDDSAATDVERRLRKLEVFETGGVELATEATRNYRVLRARGHTVRKTIDCLIATFMHSRRALAAPPRPGLRPLRGTSQES